MYELIKINDNDYYIDSPTKVGVVKVNENEVVLIDSGSDRSAAKKILNVVTEQSWTVKAIYMTHAHADHMGGNHLIQDRTNCKIYANKTEAAYANNTYLVPVCLYGGIPFRHLKHKFLLAEESNVDILNEENLENCLSLIDLKGHSKEMTGYLSKNGTAYIGDIVIAEETINKYGVGYLFNVRDVLDSLEYVKTITANTFVPSHADVVNDISVLADINKKAILTVIEQIYSYCKTPVTMETMLKNIFDQYQMNMNAQQYVLTLATLRSYLTYLFEEKKITFEFTDNIMYWKQTEN